MSLLPPPVSPEVLAAWSARAAIQRESTPGFSVLDHIRWARDIAREIRRDYNFRPASQESHDLEQVACLAVVELARRFDPSRVPPGGDSALAFRGWAAIEVRSRCRREARRLRNGGTYHTRRETPGKALVVRTLTKPLDYVDPRSEKKRTTVDDDPDDAGC